MNLGSAFEISIKDLLEMIVQVTGFAEDIVWDMTKPNGQPRRKLDTTRAKEFFWVCGEDIFSEGLKETVTWYQASLTENLYK